jgi:mannan endo-1,4-beta-mannosidase
MLKQGFGRFRKILAILLALVMLGTVFSIVPAAPVLASADEDVIYENDFESDSSAVLVGDTKALKFTYSGDVSKDWETIFQKELPATYDNPIYSGATMSFDILLPASSAYNGVFKGQAVTKMGIDWTWTQSPDSAIPEIGINDFTDSGNGYLTVHVSIAFGSNIEERQGLRAVVPCLAGSYCTYKGDIYLDNVKLVNGPSDGGEEPELPPVAPVAFTFDDPADIALWSDDGSYDYSGGVTQISYDSVLQAMKLDVDYSGNASSSWSEAKIRYTFAAPFQLEGYNRFSFDFIYDPAQMTTGSFMAKLFASGIDTNIAVGNAEDLGSSGLKKATVTLNLSGDRNSISSFTLGLVGNRTDYKGPIYIDNVSFYQEVGPDIYVWATVPVDANQIPVAVDSHSLAANGQTQEISGNIKLVDDRAKDYTAKLYAYLEAVGKTDSVLYGHQNDTHHKAGRTGANLTNSDTRDVTGSIAAVVGIDALSLTGNELAVQAPWNAPLADRVAACEAVTKAAAGEGAIITLSAHMPNFALIDERVKHNDPSDPSDSNRVGILPDGSYNFSGYTPNTLTGDIVKRIMPGQDLNYLYTGYLDMIAAYAKALEDDGISVLFRPFHECTGSWFWWGKAFCDAEAYKNLYKYTVEYLRDEKDVHNFIYVYGPGSEAESTAAYGERYPGDDYVDMVGFDMYHQNPAAGDSFIANLKAQLDIVQEFAAEHHKLFAVTETGVANPNGQVLLKTGNARKDWYNEVLDVVAPSNASYFLLWANFGEDSGGFYTPYVVSKTNDGKMKGHEMLDNFIDFYNDPRSVFAAQMGDFTGISVAVEPNTAVTGYITAPVSGSRVLDAVTIEASVKNAQESSVVKFEAKDKTGGKTIEIPAAINGNGRYEGALTGSQVAQLGESIGTISLVVDGNTLNTINIRFNMPEPVNDPTIVDTFESYYGENALLNISWSTGNATGSGVTPSLSDKSYEGEYGLEFKYTLTGGSGYAGVTKNLNGVDWSGRNALQLWTLPDGKKQKVVVQVQSGGNVFEVYLNEYQEYSGSTDPFLVTVPFSSFVGRDNPAAVFDAANIQLFGLWCNAIVPEGQDSSSFKLDSVLYYDSIKAITSNATAVKFEKLNNPGTPSTPGSSSGTPSSPSVGANSEMGRVTTVREGNRTIATIAVDEAKLREKLEAGGEKAVITIRDNTGADVVAAELSGQMLKDTAARQAVLEVKTDNASYYLPAQQINLDDIAKQIGQAVELKDVKIRIQISKPSEDAVKIVETSAKEGEFTIVAAPVEFTIKVTYGDKTFEINAFTSYVERSIAIPAGVDPDKVTTAVVVDADGTVRQVPTKIVTVNGKKYARFNSLTNSLYSLVYHPVSFSDVETHWAKEAINDMGSRMIIDAAGNSTFEPDRAITRAEFAAIIVKALGLKPKAGNRPFADVGADDPYSRYIATASEYSILSGYGNGKFGPADEITCEQAVTIIANAAKITGLKAELNAGEAEKLLAELGYSGQISAWAKESAAACAKLGLNMENGGKKLAPADKATRAEVAVIVRKLLQKSDLI